MNLIIQTSNFKQKNMRLWTENLVKKYRARTVVNKVSIEVNQGEIVGLLGPNGAGKTTSFYMIVGLIKPLSGKIFFPQLVSNTACANKISGLAPIKPAANFAAGHNFLMNSSAEEKTPDAAETSNGADFS